MPPTLDRDDSQHLHRLVSLMTDQQLQGYRQAHVEDRARNVAAGFTDAVRLSDSRIAAIDAELERRRRRIKTG